MAMLHSGRVVFIGETRVGKSSLIQRYVQGQFSSQSQTVGATFHTTPTKYRGTDVTLQIWDTAGQERYRSVGPIYYRKSSAAVAVFDLNQPATMTALTDWIQTFREHADDNFVVIVGNKSDLETTLTIDETDAFAERFGAQCIWASASSGEHVQDIFDAVANHLIRRDQVELPISEDIEILATPGTAMCGCRIF
jgi:small GTP-binding protein